MNNNRLHLLHKSNEQVFAHDGLDKLWVVTVISNPERYRSRYELYHRFKKGIENNKHANLFTVEVAFGNRAFEVTEEGNPNHLQLRTNEEIWNKENAINLAVQRLPQDWRNVMFVDADIEFCRQDWAEETIHQLQHFDVIQCFQTAVDLGPDGEVIQTMDGFVHSWMNNKPKPYSKGAEGPHYHPGYTWAMRRAAFDALSGLIDWAILGAADHHAAWALVGKVIEYSPKQISDAYKKHLLIWQDRATKHIKQNIGFLPGTIIHHWHSRKQNRGYTNRWKILFKHNFDPELDLKKDWQGLYQLSDAGLRLRNDLRNYFRSRNEDSIDL